MFHQSIPSKEAFELICQYAREENREGLAELLEKNYCLEIRIGIHTPLSLLAFQGEDNAVECLLNYVVSPNAAASGYAMRGEVIKPQQLVKRGASVAAIVEGYAAGKFFEIMTSFLNGNKEYTEAAVIGLGMSASLDVWKNVDPKGDHQIEFIIGLAIAHEKNLVNTLITEAENETKKNELIQVALKGYFMSLGVEEAEELLKKYPQKDFPINHFYMIGGHLEKCKTIDRFTLDHLTICAQAGHVLLAEKIVSLEVKLSSWNEKLTGLKMIALPFSWVRDSGREALLCDGLLKPYQSRGYFANEAIALRLLTFSSVFSSYLTRQGLLDFAKENKLSLDMDALISKATNMQKEMKVYHLSYSEAVAKLNPSANSTLFSLSNKNSSTREEGENKIVNRIKYH